MKIKVLFISLLALISSSKLEKHNTLPHHLNKSTAESRGPEILAVASRTGSGNEQIHPRAPGVAKSVVSRDLGLVQTHVR
jgi:hypothetical protein